MSEFFFRTEDIKPEEVCEYFVETARDREIVNAVKARNPAIVAGSRGVGKSFLLRVAEAELRRDMATSRVFPVYVTFTRSSLINTTDPYQFQHWMLAKICARLVRSLTTSGLLSAMPAGLSILSGQPNTDVNASETKMERLAAEFENSWKHPSANIDLTGLPTVEAFKDAVEDLCGALAIARFVILIDEAAHIFLPEQQRQFFTLFRDLRSPYVSCNAAVYPGVTSYGETFQPIHDATMLTLERDLLSSDYVSNMREIVEKQAESEFISDIARNGQNFAILSYAASGNPRILLKTLQKTPRLNSQSTNTVIREYYRNDIWAEHSTLPEKYPGHRTLIDWGRRFIEDEVLPELQKKNTAYLQADQKSTCFFWIHRDAPQPVKEALRLLAYTGVVSEHASGIKATRGFIGTRYAVNLGCLISLEATPTSTGLQVAQNLTPRRMSEYGLNHSSYHSLLTAVPTFAEPDIGEILAKQLSKAIEVLDITEWQKGTLQSLGLSTIGGVLHATETKLQEAAYVGEKRSRRIRNAAIAAVYEYLSG